MDFEVNIDKDLSFDTNTGANCKKGKRLYIYIVFYGFLPAPFWICLPVLDCLSLRKPLDLIFVSKSNEPHQLYIRHLDSGPSLVFLDFLLSLDFIGREQVMMADLSTNIRSTAEQKAVLLLQCKSRSRSYCTLLYYQFHSYRKITVYDHLLTPDQTKKPLCKYFLYGSVQRFSNDLKHSVLLQVKMVKV